MTTYTTIPDSDVDPESPVTTSLVTALRDNPIAITEGAAGAPSIVEAALATAVQNQLVTNGDTHDHSGGDGGTINLSSLSVSNVTANTTIKHFYDDTEYTSTSGIYVLMTVGIKFIVPRNGTYRVSFDMKSSNATIENARIYKNGVAHGTAQSTTSTSYVTKTEDLSFSAGDYVEIWGTNNSSGTVYVTNFIVSTSEELLG